MATPRSIQTLQKYGINPEESFNPPPSGARSAGQAQGAIPGLIDFFLGPGIRSLQNTATAATTIPQAGIASLMSQISPQAGAQFASADPLRGLGIGQKRAEEISNDPEKAIKKQLSDSASLLIDAATAHYGPKVFSKIGETISPNLAANRLTQKGVQAAGENTVQGGKLAEEIFKEAANTKVTLARKPSFQKGLFSLIDDFSSRNLTAKELQKEFLKYGEGFTERGVKKTSADAALDRIVRKAIRVVTEEIGAGDVIKATEKAAAGKARRKTIGKTAGYLGRGAAFGGGGAYLLSKLAGR